MLTIPVDVLIVFSPKQQNFFIPEKLYRQRLNIEGVYIDGLCSDESSINVFE